MTKFTGNWNYPTNIRFGPGRIAELADACRVLGITRPLLVTDRGLGATPMVAEALSAARTAGLDITIFNEISSDPSSTDVARGSEALRAHGSDGVVAFGGGSSLDAGKAIAFATFQQHPLWDFEDIGDNFTRADPTRILPVIAVPTTAGTGSEVGRASVIKDEDAQLKRIIFHPMMLPKIVIADPVLTVGLPSALTAAVGMDALSHNLEAFFAPGYHPFARGIALEGARLVKDWLGVAVREPGNIEARANMLAASQAGATAFQRGLGAMHALAHPLGALYGVHHGLLNAVLMPYVVEANRSAIERDSNDLAAALGLGGGVDGILAWILDLRREIGIPDTLAEIGVPGDEIGRVAQMAVEDSSAGTNPILLTADAYAVLFQKALVGEHVQSA
jgi:alcohol dehydrogenase class IV